MRGAPSGSTAHSPAVIDGGFLRDDAQQRLRWLQASRCLRDRQTA
jgi:hypothetical protein